MNRSMREDLDCAMAGIVLSDVRRQAILEAMRKGEKPMKRVIRPILVLAAVLAALTISALALSPTIRELMSGAMGEFAPYSQDVEGVTATDQGIQFRVLSAISDGNVATVYFEVRDLKQDRLDAEVLLDTGRIDRPEADYAAASFSSPKCLGYDPDTRTALFRFTFTGDGKPSMGGTLHLEFDSILPDADRFGESPFPNVDLDSKELASKTLATGEAVLLPGQTPAKLENTDELELSSFGFASDGMLHILYQLNHENVNREDTWLRTTLESKAEEGNAANEYQRTARYNLSGTKEDYGFNYYEQSGILYLDMLTGVTPEDLEDVSLRSVWGAIVTKPKVQGVWVLDVPLEDVEHRTIPMSTAIGKIVMQSMDFTTLGATLESDPNGSAGTLGYPLAVFLADGSRVLAGSSDSYFHSGGYVVNHWTFLEPMDTSKIVGFSIGQWYTPLVGDTEGKGRWLDEVPQ